MVQILLIGKEAGTYAQGEKYGNALQATEAAGVCVTV